MLFGQVCPVQGPKIVHREARAVASRNAAWRHCTAHAKVPTLSAHSCATVLSRSPSSSSASRTLASALSVALSASTRRARSSSASALDCGAAVKGFRGERLGLGLRQICSRAGGSHARLLRTRARSTGVTHLGDLLVPGSQVLDAIVAHLLQLLHRLGRRVCHHAVCEQRQEFLSKAVLSHEKRCKVLAQHGVLGLATDAAASA